MFTDPDLRLVNTITGARTYHFRSTKPLGGWALCTVNDGTGELLITSDWGNWAYLWGLGQLGRPSLTHFLDHADHDYVARKLLGREGCRTFDAERTIARWQRELAEARLREGRRHAVDPDAFKYRPPLSRSLAREIWDQIGGLIENEHNATLFVECALEIPMDNWVTERPWDALEYRDSFEYRVLVGYLLPALATACRNTLANKASTDRGIVNAASGDAGEAPRGAE